MRTIRRLYLYAVAFVSLETVLWGLINLLRASLDTSRVGGSASQLAGALALILVGLPVFLLHWWLIQRRIGAQPEERGAGLRGVFLYATLTVLLIPVVQNGLALVNRLVLLLFSIDPTEALLGSDQLWTDNLIAILMNALLAGYFINVIRGDWRAGTAQDAENEPISLENLTLSRRVNRYFWSVYGLGLLVFGLQQVLAYTFDLLGPPGVLSAGRLANGLALILVGGPLWVLAWRQVQAALASPEEANSIFRLVVLYGLVFVGVGGVLIPTGNLAYQIFRLLLGYPLEFPVLISRISPFLSALIPFTGVWVYYGRIRHHDLEALPDSPRRDGLRRLYGYLRALIGLITSFIGLVLVTDFLVELLLGGTTTGTVGRDTLAAALSTLLIGLPLWLWAWLPVTREAGEMDARGDYARRSVVRKAYLYLALFIGVVGAMGTAGGFIFEVLRSLLGDPSDNQVLTLSELFKNFILFAGLLLYHWNALRTDGRLAERSLAEKHQEYPVLVLSPAGERFGEPLAGVLRSEMPEIPVVIHPTAQGAPAGDLVEARAVVLPSTLAANPPEALRIWLKEFAGVKLVVPVVSDAWLWVDTSSKPLEHRAKIVARAVRQLAEGDEVQLGSRTSPWVTAAAIFGGFIGLMVLISIVGSILSELF